jgi:16S rRNA (cytidine1402-2'-O)-methyltransferase
MTKLHEQTLRTTLSDAASYFEANAPRGEFVIVVEGAQTPQLNEADMESAVESVNSYVAAGMGLRDAARRVSAETGLSKNRLYDAAQNARGGGSAGSRHT